MPHASTNAQTVKQKNDARNANVVRNALSTRQPLNVIQSLCLKAEDLSEGHTNHVGMEMLPQIAFVLGNVTEPNNEQDKDKLPLFLLSPWCGLIVLETWSQGVPIIATNLKISAKNAEDNNNKITNLLLNFSSSINHPVDPAKDKIPLTEGVASLYLRLLAQVVSSMKKLNEIVDFSNINNNNDEDDDGKSENVTDKIDLAQAYRSLIQSLSDQNTKQASTAQYTSELKKFSVRRRFFSPVLQVAAEQGLPVLCIEVLNSVDDVRSNLGGLKSSMVRMYSANKKIMQEQQQQQQQVQEQEKNAKQENDNNKEPNTTTIANSDDSNNVSDEESDEENNSNATTEPPAGSIRQRDETESSKNQAPASTIYDEMKVKKQEKREQNREFSNKHHQQNVSEPCELWECDFALMIEALAKKFENKNQEQELTAANEDDVVFARNYLDRVLAAVSVSTPLVGAKFVEAIARLAEKTRSTPFHVALNSSTSKVRLPPQNTLNDRSPCTCTSCNAAVGGPSLELNKEEASMLADAIKNKLILPRIRSKCHYKAPEVLQHALQKFQNFEELCRSTLSPSSVVVDGANIGFYGVRAWYAEAKREMMTRKGIPESAWAADELDISARRSRGLSTDVPPNFAQIDMAIQRTAKSFPGRDFVVVFHERHLSEASLTVSAHNVETLEKWKKNLTSNIGENNNNGPRVIVASSPAEVNDDWCWMFMSLCFSERSYLCQDDMDKLMKPNEKVVDLENNNIVFSTSLPVVILTNDLMRDHITGLLPGKEEAGWKFLRYRWLHQVKCVIAWNKDKITGEQMMNAAILKFPNRYHTWPVRFGASNNNDDDDDMNHPLQEDCDHSTKNLISWHIPFTNSILKQGTAKAGLSAHPENNKKNNNKKNLHDDDGDAATESAKEVRLPEQLLDMLAFAATEAEGKMLCVQF